MLRKAKFSFISLNAPALIPDASAFRIARQLWSTSQEFSSVDSVIPLRSAMLISTWGMNNRPVCGHSSERQSHPIDKNIIIIIPYDGSSIYEFVCVVIIVAMIMLRDSGLCMLIYTRMTMCVYQIRFSRHSWRSIYTYLIKLLTNYLWKISYGKVFFTCWMKLGLLIFIALKTATELRYYGLTWKIMCNMIKKNIVFQ
jgi:hypothetical protein